MGNFKYISNYGLLVFPCGKICKSIGDHVYKPQDNNGYKQIQKFIDGKRRTLMVHRLVAMAFIPNPENKPEVNHIDGNKANNHYVNLEWTTKSENIKHGYDTGLLENVRKSKAKPVRNEMIKKLAEMGYSQGEIAKAFKMTQANVSIILK